MFQGELNEPLEGHENLSSRLDNKSSQDHALAAVEAFISNVRSWLIYNRLLVNNFKIEVLGCFSLRKSNIVFLSRFAPIVFAHRYWARKLTRHVMRESTR